MEPESETSRCHEQRGFGLSKRTLNPAKTQSATHISDHTPSAKRDGRANKRGKPPARETFQNESILTPIPGVRVWLLRSKKRINKEIKFKFLMGVFIATTPLPPRPPTAASSRAPRRAPGLGMWSWLLACCCQPPLHQTHSPHSSSCALLQHIAQRRRRPTIYSGAY